MALLLWLTIACLCFIGSAGAKANRNLLQTLKYSELEKLGASCAPKDTCSEPRRPEDDNLSTSRCQCQASCAKANTCCIDSPHVRFMPAYWNRTKGTCESPFPGPNLILAVSKCEPGWSGSPKVKAMCEELDIDQTDPIGQSPATNTRTEVTYRNYFCALCNNDIDSLVFWQLELEISQIGYATSGQSFDRNNILESLQRNEYGQWAVEALNEKNEIILQSVLITYAAPDHISHMLTPCTPMVSECSEDWQDDNVRAMCRAYMGIVYLSPNESTFEPVVPYRNIHCAICNNIEYNLSTVCDKVVYGGYGGKPPFSFTLLLDVNLADGDKVGEVNRCGKGMMYDHFFKKCRTLTCAIPGYSMQEGKCVKV